MTRRNKRKKTFSRNWTHRSWVHKFGAFIYTLQINSLLWFVFHVVMVAYHIVWFAWSTRTCLPCSRNSWGGLNFQSIKIDPVSLTSVSTMASSIASANPICGSASGTIVVYEYHYEIVFYPCFECQSTVASEPLSACTSTFENFRTIMIAQNVGNNFKRIANKI